MPDIAALDLRSLSRQFNGTWVLSDVSLCLGQGEVISIIGPSGSGKSTLARCIAGLETFGAGTLRLFGAPAPALWREPRRFAQTVGYIFQDFNLWPHFTALKNISLPLVKTLGTPPGEAQARALTLLAKVGLEDKAHALPKELSGGQKQRVAIARALALKPRLLILDEPTSALDPELVSEVLDVIRQLAASGMSLLVITHEMSFARDISNRILFMEHGRIVEQGTPGEIFDGAASPRVKKFLAHFTGSAAAPRQMPQQA